MKTSHIIAINIAITVILLGGFYYAINRYGTEFLTGVWDKNGVTKVINQKVIQENVSEYRKLSDMQSDITKAIDTVSTSVMHIVRSADTSSSLSGGIISSIQGGGSAIVITSNGYLLTNKHVVSNLKDKYVAVTEEGRKLPVTNIWLDPTMDLAILKVSDATGKAVSDLKAATFVSTDSTINLGQFTVSLGSSQSALSFMQAMGTISQKDVLMNTSGGDTSTSLSYIRTDARIAPGFSGGPTFDLQGNIFGITTAMQNGDMQGSLILPVTREMIQQMLDSILATSKISRNPFGATLLHLNSYVAQQLGLKKFSGWYVQKVTTGSPANTAGLMVGDVIAQIDGKDVQTDLSLAHYWLGYGSGDTIEFTIYREDAAKKLSLSVK